MLAVPVGAVPAGPASIPVAYSSQWILVAQRQMETYFRHLAVKGGLLRSHRFAVGHVDMLQQVKGSDDDGGWLKFSRPRRVICFPSQARIPLLHYVPYKGNCFNDVGKQTGMNTKDLGSANETHLSTSFIESLWFA